MSSAFDHFNVMCEVLFTRTVLVSVKVVSVVTYCLTARMSSKPNLPVKRSVTIGTMINFDGDGDRDGDRHGKCK